METVRAHATLADSASATQGPGFRLGCNMMLHRINGVVSDALNGNTLRWQSMDVLGIMK